MIDSRLAGRRHSIEPIPVTFEILRANVRRLRLSNVVLMNCAISDVNGFATMEIPLWEAGGENLYMQRLCQRAAAVRCDE